MAAPALTKDADAAKDDEITIERRVRVPEAVSAEYSNRKTTKMGRVDARLLAIARGDREPEPTVDLFLVDDPFGGLIPVDEAEVIEILDEWVLEEVSEPGNVVLDGLDVLEDAIAFSAVPRICMATSELVALPLDHRTGFLLSHIDGERSIDEIIDICQLSPADTLSVIASLVALRAIRVD